MTLRRTSPFWSAIPALGAVCVFAGVLFAGPDSRVGGPNPGDPPVLLPGQTPWQLQGVGIDEHLGRTIDLGLTFTAENGSPVKLADYFNQGRPVILDLVYYKCPMLCTLILNAQTQTMRDLAWTPGKDYEVVTISIDPRETSDVASEKKAIYLSTYDRPAPGWHFLADRDGNAKKLAELMGFHYRYDEKQQQFAHASAIMILTPSGVISRYLYGIHYPSRDVRFALAEAGEGKLTHGGGKAFIVLLSLRPPGESLCVVRDERHADRWGLNRSSYFIHVVASVPDRPVEDANVGGGAGTRPEPPGRNCINGVASRPHIAPSGLRVR